MKFNQEAFSFSCVPTTTNKLLSSSGKKAVEWVKLVNPASLTHKLLSDNEETLMIVYRKAIHPVETDTVRR